MGYRFANILLAGPCNLRCPYCIGQRLPRRGSNLDDFPLAGLALFAARLRREGIVQISLTGTDTEPLLYRHPRALVAYLRDEVPGAVLSLHTNGMLVHRRLDVVHLFDRVAVSMPSFSPTTFRTMTGSERMLDLAALLDAVRIPVKVSTTVTPDNVSELEDLIERCARLGVRRLSLRRVYDPATDSTERLPILEGRRPVSSFGGNPVFSVQGVEVTVWEFDSSDLSCLNLFADGTVSDDYLLDAAPSAAGAEPATTPWRRNGRRTLRRASADDLVSIGGA